jgi:uncharacterized SAM-binding protein YcdF (DUF218 family)
VSLGSFGGLLGELRALIRVYRGAALPPAPDEVEVAVVLGTEVLPDGRPSRTLEARVRHAARLYLEGRVSKLIPTGGLGENPPAEAAVMGLVLREEGIPAEDVVIEDRALNTWDSARLVAGIARKLGNDRVLVVTDPLHCVRTVASFELAGLAAWAEPAYDSPMWRERWSRRGQLIREAGALVWYRIRYGVGSHSPR